MLRVSPSPLPIHLERLELLDCNAADSTPSAPAQSFITWDNVADMARNEAARPEGYVDALCLGCGVALFVPETERCGDVLCTACQRTGEAIADAEDDDKPRPPSGGAAPVPPRDDPAYFGPAAGQLGDDQLVSAVHLADAKPHTLGLDSSAVHDAALSAFTAEVLRRLDQRQAPRRAA